MKTISLTSNLSKALKTTFALLLFCVFSMSAAAQRFDIFGGINMTGVPHKIGGEKQDGSGNIGYHVGMSLFVPFNMKAYKDDVSSSGNGLLPTLQFVKKGTSKSSIINNSAADIKLSYLQFNLPLAFSSGSYGIGVGPFVSYALSGTKKFRVGNGAKEKIDFGNDLSRIDYGVGIHMQIGLFKFQYDLGLANLVKSANGTAKTRSLSLSFSIPITE